jgi:anti-anti-sigma regulatory factor
LLALSLAARARGQTFSLHQPSPVLREAARRLGLAPDLMISPEEDSV